MVDRTVEGRELPEVSGQDEGMFGVGGGGREWAEGEWLHRAGREGIKKTKKTPPHGVCAVGKGTCCRA